MRLENAQVAFIQQIQGFVVFVLRLWLLCKRFHQQHLRDFIFKRGGLL